MGPTCSRPRDFYLFEGPFRRDFILVTVASLLFIWILQASQLQRGRDVFNFILGRYHRPQESELVFLFVDLTASTTIAEDLGHLRYSGFLQDFFFDLNTPSCHGADRYTSTSVTRSSSCGR